MTYYCNRRLIASYEELPIINGRRIHSIYGRMETAYYEKGRLLEDAYDEKPDYYLLCTDDKDHSLGWKNNKKYPAIRTRNLPKEISQFFGKQLIPNSNISIDVTTLYFRTSDSGNGSFIDQFCDFGGGCGATSKNIIYYRTKRWEDAYYGAVFEGEEFANRIDSILGKKFTVEELPEHFNVEYPCSYIRKIGNINYPDVKCSGWRWSYGDPYISIIYDDRGLPDRSDIRVYLEDMNVQLYLSKEKEFNVGDDHLVSVSFSYRHDKKPEQFCHVLRRNDKIIFRWKILKINKDDTIDTVAMVNGKEHFKRSFNKRDLYTINRTIYEN